MIAQIAKYLLLNIILIEFFLFFKLLKKIKIIVQNLKNIKNFFIKKKFLETKNEKEYFSYIGLVIKNCFFLFFLFLFLTLIIFLIKFVDPSLYKNLYTYKFIIISILFSLSYVIIRIKLS